MHIIHSKDPGPWLSWVKRPENRNLHINEARVKFKREQILFNEQQNSYIASQIFQNQQKAIQADQAPNAGVTLNKVMNVSFNATPVFTSITACDPELTVKFKWPVVVTGTPTITVNNSQAGGGSAATFTYEYKSGSGTSSLIFDHNHGSFPANNGGASANVISLGIDLVATGATVGTITDATDGVYAAPTYTETGGNGLLDMQVTVASNEITSAVVTTAGATYQPGDILTFNAGQLGASSTGGTITLAKDNFTGDVISLPGQTIALSGGSIQTFAGGEFNTLISDCIRRQGPVPPLSFIAQSSTTTVVAE
tara:strand:+ start:15519 stop:16448 length:930 start_codon:yes stop_codon:yes gene_type:complete